METVKILLRMQQAIAPLKAFRGDQVRSEKINKSMRFLTLLYSAIKVDMSE